MPRQTSMITKAILEDHANGMSRQAISEKYGLSYSVVASAIWRQTQKKATNKKALPKPVKVEQVPPTPAKVETLPVKQTFWQRLKNFLGL